MPLIVAESLSRKAPEKKATITIAGSQEAVDRVLCLLSLIEFNGAIGHSSVCGISWDGDGSDRIDIKGDYDAKRYKDFCRTVIEYGATAEVVGQNLTPFVITSDGRMKNVKPSE